MIPSSSALLLIAFSGVAVKAANPTGEPTNSANYPLCGQTCQNANLPSTGCGSISNRTCVCKLSSASPLNICEVQTCSASDFQIIQDLVYALCNPVGGIGNNVSNASYTTPASAPTPTAFTGGAAAVMRGWVGWSVVGLIGALGWQVLL